MDDLHKSATFYTAVFAAIYFYELTVAHVKLLPN